MKIAVVGPGAMGSLFAAFLTRSKAKHDVWILDKDADRAKKLDANGIIVEGSSNFTQKINATTDPKKIDICDLVIIFTKSYDTEKALSSIKPMLGEKTNVLSLQNGLGNLQLICDAVGEDRAVGGIAICGAILERAGKVKVIGKPEIIIGRLSGKIFGELRHISTLFNEAGIPAKISKDINGVIWSKLIINVGINAIASICRLKNGALLEYEGARELMRQAVVEATKVAKRKRIKLIYDDPLQKVESICSETSDNICSMLQDIMRSQPTEIDFINGAIIRQGKSSGVKTPVNEILTQLIKSVEASYKKQV
ncbi:MAG: 2-dehydropantoate 2-reductase [Candidatus Omnitrophota bacterium]